MRQCRTLPEPLEKRARVVLVNRTKLRPRQELFQQILLPKTNKVISRVMRHGRYQQNLHNNCISSHPKGSVAFLKRQVKPSDFDPIHSNHVGQSLLHSEAGPRMGEALRRRDLGQQVLAKAVAHKEGVGPIRLAAHQPKVPFAGEFHEGAQGCAGIVGAIGSKVRPEVRTVRNGNRAVGPPQMIVLNHHDSRPYHIDTRGRTTSIALQIQ